MLTYEQSYKIYIYFSTILFTKMLYDIKNKGFDWKSVSILNILKLILNI